ncbi:MAG: hypothetical protein GY716_07165 [bacterium]|nr:hypothetical protein [bacterium]
MRAIAYTIVIVFLTLCGSAILAGATQDLRVEKTRDDRGKIVHELVNIGERNVKAKVRHTKTCSSTTSLRKPIEREHWLGPKARQQLRKVIPNSDCRHTYRVVKAEYY